MFKTRLAASATVNRSVGNQSRSRLCHCPLLCLRLLKPTTAGLVFRTLTGTRRCLENSFLCLTYIAETLDVWRWNKLALAKYYDTLYVSRLFDIRDSGVFPTFPPVLSFSVSMILADSVSIRDHTFRISFPTITSNQSFGFIHSYHLLLRSFFSSSSLLQSGSPSIKQYKLFVIFLTLLNLVIPLASLAHFDSQYISNSVLSIRDEN